MTHTCTCVIFNNMYSSIIIVFISLMYQGRPQDLAGGGVKNFFSDLEICMSRSDMLRMAKPCALLGWFGGMPPPPEKFFLNGAIWCVLVYILIRFCRQNFLKITIFYIKNLKLQFFI